ncbi:SUMF1/EgtB/PvdO family nonheme iron enzyme [Roseobacter sp. EG26]|uniref:SUMF1/EgtB/PvdO family nonheme iron enzyme n=1 Tax=Roseobacter sp. EG26 TaxID=3412477 RepID=UPI003CE54343
MKGFGLGVALVAFAGAYVVFSQMMRQSLPDDLPEMLSLPAGTVEYRPTGEFRTDGRVRTAPLEKVEIPGNLEMMRYPVTQQAYMACVRDGACKSTHSSDAPDLPQTQVNFRDALDFAEWQSKRTGQKWRLPTGAEWAHAAAERYVDDALDEAPTGDMAQRWLDEYRTNTKQRENADPSLRAIGAYGENALGIGYIGGNVWEWTTTCFKKAELTAEGDYIRESDDYCGVRLAQGIHRAFVIDFVRDASVGGCAVGLPPDHLVIRLIRES